MHVKRKVCSFNRFGTIGVQIFMGHVTPRTFNICCAQTGTHEDRQTDRHTSDENIISGRSLGGKNNNSEVSGTH